MTEQTKVSRINIAETENTLVSLLATLGKLDPDADPTAFVGLAAGIFAAHSSIVFDIAKSLRGIEGALVTIAQAQEGMLQVALTDVNEIIKETIEKGVDEGVKDAINKRSFIGRVPD